MTTKAPNIETWSAPLAKAIDVGNKLLGGELVTKAELNWLRWSGTDDYDREARAAKYAAGEIPQPPFSSKREIDDTESRSADIQLARKLNADQQRDLRISEGRRMCTEELKPRYDASAKKFAEHLVGINEFLAASDDLKGSLLAQGIGFYPIVCNLDVGMFGSPRDPGSAIVRLLRECVSRGYLNKLPPGLR